MHPRVNQDLGDSVAEAVAIQDAEQPIDRGLRVVLACQVVGQRVHGVVIALLEAAVRGAMLTQLRAVEVLVGQQTAG